MLLKITNISTKVADFNSICYQFQQIVVCLLFFFVHSKKKRKLCFVYSPIRSKITLKPKPGIQIAIFLGFVFLGERNICVNLWEF